MIYRSLDQVTEFPLCWPEAKPRAAQRKQSPFYNTSLAKSLREIGDEIKRWRVSRYRVSMFPAYRRSTRDDPAVVLWWDMPMKPGSKLTELRVLACDTYHHQECNGHAIALTLQALRAVERWGTYTLEQAVEGARAALPPPPGYKPVAADWWEILGVGTNWPLDAVEMAYRMKAEKAHPDRGGDPDEMARLNGAIEIARRELANG